MYYEQQLKYEYYTVTANNFTEAHNFLNSHIPQVGITLSGTAAELSISLVLHTTENVGNTILYNYDVISSRNIEGSPVLIKLLNAMHSYQQSNQTNSFGIFIICNNHAIVPYKSSFQSKLYYHELHPTTAAVIVFSIAITFSVLCCYQIAR